MKNGFRVPPESYNSNYYAPELWTKNGKPPTDDDFYYHRIDGPAVIHEDGRHIWIVNNMICHSFHEFQTLSNSTDEQMAMLILKYGRLDPYP